MVDSGRVCSIQTKALADNISMTTPTAPWIASACENDLKTLSNQPIKVLGKIATTDVFNV